jgi:serine/threonine protein kinase/tetratricopeptide (TPR) repeat protein
MHAERWERVEALLDALLELPAADRAAFLDRECGGDVELHAEVGRLLAACESPDLFPDQPAALFAAPLLASDRSGAAEAAGGSATPAGGRIGVFRVVRELGRGGMGAVFLAERDDGEFEQRVAIKLLRRLHWQDTALLQRFRRERQLLARLEHPHIARLLDGGLTAEGQPYFVMEYVEGQPIDRYCDDRQLPVGARIELFLTVCQAVAHAHRQSIVHRDLKPSNIMVTADGHVKLLDFGIARLLTAEALAGEADGLTRTGERLLTPEYASPEQIRGAAVTETSDVYALGVLLYELLTGSRPHPRAGRTPHEHEGVILTEEPTLPSTMLARENVGPAVSPSGAPGQISRDRRASPDELRRQLRGDLDAIVLKALRKEPERRYVGADALASDLRRHLQGLPILARREAGSVRLRRFARSHPVGLAVAACVLLAGVAFAVLEWSGAGLRGERGPVGDQPSGRASPAADPAWIVVAPLENRTGDAALDPLGVMAAEWITQALWRTALVNVIDVRTVLETATAVMESGETQPLRALAERTGAGTVVSGSYYLEAERLRFQAQITEAATGRVRHSTEVVYAPRDRPLEALDPIRQRVTGALAVLLDERLNTWAVTASHPPIYEAYQEFLLGMAAFGTDFPTAIAHFARASALDPTHWQAYLWEGQAHANRRDYTAADSVFGLLLPRRSQLAPYDQANLDYFHLGFVRGDWLASYDGARRMVELAPAAPHALFALGSTAALLNRCAEAIDALERIDTGRGWGRSWSARVLRLVPRCLHGMGEHPRELQAARQLRDSDPSVGWTRLAEVRALAAMGRVDELLERVEEAMAFPPTDVTQTWESFSPGDFLHEAARELAAHGNPALAATLQQRAISWFRGRPASERNSVQYRRELARLLYASGQFDEATELYRILAHADTGEIVFRGTLALLALHQQRVQEADSLASLLRNERRPYLFGRPQYWLARIAARTGEPARAVELLRQAHRDGFVQWAPLHVEPDLAPLRAYAPFQELVRPAPLRRGKRSG